MDSHSELQTGVLVLEESATFSLDSVVTSKMLLDDALIFE